ncbi:MAG: phospholipid carrier-dependent glycosyltransferase [Phycisphaerales bacterium]|nr:phospholipid carrier-dependent glycosyltransferase [Phycisphaerales bacterium]
MPQPQRSVSPRALVWVGIVALFFTAVAPTLSWLEFSGGMENLNIATALELRRDHPDNWLIPTLEGKPRVKKPPLTAWLTAHAIRPQTVAAMSDADPQVRDAAATRLAWEARWPSLLAACLMLVAIYELGRVVADPTTGLVAALICGTTGLFLKFGRSAMIDVHLGLWVTIANVFLAHAILKGRRWSGCIGAGVALGLAFLLKGPIAWVQTLAPVVLFVVVRQWSDERDPDEPRTGGILRWIAPIVVGLLLMCAIALPWYLYILRTVPGAWDVWTHEAIEERGEKPSSILGYLALLPYILPWTICFLGGLVTARRNILLAVFLAVLPLVLMSFYKDRKERYMFPVAGAAAVVAAAGIVTLARKREPWNALDRAAVIQHWVLLVAVALLLPAAAATTRIPELTTLAHAPWLSRGAGAALTISLGVIIAALMLVRRHWLAALMTATVVVMLATHAIVIHGYAQTRAGLSDMRPLARAIWQTHPDALMYNAHPLEKRASVDLSIYMNRITTWASPDDLAKMTPGPQPKVVVMLQDPKSPDPVPPPGWKFLAKTTRDKDWWWAFVLESK